MLLQQHSTKTQWETEPKKVQNVDLVNNSVCTTTCLSIDIHKTQEAILYGPEQKILLSAFLSGKEIWRTTRHNLWNAAIGFHNRVAAEG